MSGDDGPDDSRRPAMESVPHFAKSSFARSLFATGSGEGEDGGGSDDLLSPNLDVTSSFRMSELDTKTTDPMRMVDADDSLAPPPVTSAVSAPIPAPGRGAGGRARAGRRRSSVTRSIGSAGPSMPRLLETAEGGDDNPNEGSEVAGTKPPAFDQEDEQDHTKREDGWMTTRSQKKAEQRQSLLSRQRSRRIPSSSVVGGSANNLRGSVTDDGSDVEGEESTDDPDEALKRATSAPNPSAKDPPVQQNQFSMSTSALPTLAAGGQEFGQEQVLEQYRIMAQHEAAARVKANTGLDLNSRDNKADSSSADGKGSSARELPASASSRRRAAGGSQSQPGAPLYPRPREGRALPVPKPVEPTLPPSRLHHRYMKVSPMVILPSSRPPSELCPGILLPDDGAAPVLDVDEHFSLCLGCRSRLKVKTLSSLVSCPHCETVSPASSVVG